jgi:hypothetical protein
LTPPPPPSIFVLNKTINGAVPFPYLVIVTLLLLSYLSLEIGLYETRAKIVLVNKPVQPVPVVRDTSATEIKRTKVQGQFRQILWEFPLPK